MKKGRPLRVAFLKVEYNKGEELEQDRSRYSKACFFFFLFFFFFFFFFFFSFVLPLLVLVRKCPEIKVLIKKIQKTDFVSKPKTRTNKQKFYNLF